jgi:hypothetical protein
VERTAHVLEESVLGRIVTGATSDNSAKAQMIGTYLHDFVYMVYKFGPPDSAQLEHKVRCFYNLKQTRSPTRFVPICRMMCTDFGCLLEPAIF